MMSTFLLAWIVTAAVLLALAAAAGNKAGKGPLGILVDNRGRYSLSQFQIVLWTITILSSVIGVFFANGLDPMSIKLTPQLLGLMGISLGSTVLATGVKGAKDAPGAKANVARVGQFTESNGSTTRTIEPKPSQMWLEEEGDQADEVVSVAKYQNFVATLVVFVVYIVAAVKTNALPALPENLVWLMGISHAGYVGGKVPDKK